MNTNEMSILGAVLFVIVVVVAFVFLWRKKRPATLDELITMATQAVQNSEQLFLKENMAKSMRFSTAVDLLMESYPQLKGYRPKAEALIRAAVFAMNEMRAQSKPAQIVMPQVLPMPDQNIMLMSTTGTGTEPTKPATPIRPPSATIKR